MLSSKKSRGKGVEKPLSPEELQSKINETRKLIAPYANKIPALCSDASVIRYLKARNWNAKRAGKMLKQSLKWRLEFKPENIRWEDISVEAETGKIYRANYFDKQGRAVLVMRPGYQNTNSLEGQIKYLVYCIENAILNSKENQEQMLWLINFERWNSSSISVKVTRETAHVLQDHYPERLGLAILYNPPKLFESFWTMVKPFIEPKTFKKVRFVYSDNPQSQKIMEELFDMDKLETTFGGRNPVGFNYESYRERMKADDLKKSQCVNSDYQPPVNADDMMQTETSDATDESASPSSDEEETSSNKEDVGEEDALNGTELSLH